MGKDGCPHYTLICDPCATISCRPFMICVEDEDNKPKCICKKGYFEDPNTGDCISKYFMKVRHATIQALYDRDEPEGRRFKLKDVASVWRF